MSNHFELILILHMLISARDFLNERRLSSIVTEKDDIGIDRTAKIYAKINKAIIRNVHNSTCTRFSSSILHVFMVILYTCILYKYKF